MRKTVITAALFSLFSATAFASGFGVFTQGASGLGQANAVVAHPVGPASLYFNPALLNDLPGNQIEIGVTAVQAERSVKLDSGATEKSQDNWNFPPTFYYTRQIDEKLSAGIGLFFPFGLSTAWDGSYEGRYIGTSGDITTLNLNPAISYRLTDKISIAAGVSLLYIDAILKKDINQTVAYALVNAQSGGALPPLSAPLEDIGQEFKGDGWGYGFNLGALFKATDNVSVGATYRSHIDADIEGKSTFSHVEPLLSSAITDTDGEADFRLPAQATVGVAYQINPSLVIEAGVRWEDWKSFKELRIDLDNPVLGQTVDITPRNWKSTWSYNIGGQYKVDNNWALDMGYLYGENAVPGSTFEPLIPDTDAHLFTLGLEWTQGAWTIVGAFGYEYHGSRKKNNQIADPLASQAASIPVNTANGNYEADIFLYGLSIINRF